MRLKINRDTVCIVPDRVCIVKLRDFPRIFCEFHDGVIAGTDKDTLAIEKSGARLLKDGFGDIVRANDFVKSVFLWGGRTGNRVRGMVYKHQTPAQVAKMVGEAAISLRSGNTKKAAEDILKVKGLAISYGSKILRMLSPQHIAVYDSVLEKRLSYSPTPDGFESFCADCREIGAELKSRNITNPLRKNGEWFAADVEAVIFREVRNDLREQIRA